MCCNVLHLLLFSFTSKNKIWIVGLVTTQLLQKGVTIVSVPPDHFDIEGRKDQYFGKVIKLIQNDVKP